MIRPTLIIAALSLFTFVACEKSGNASSSISLAASTDVATVGEQVAVTLSTSANASKWTVSPSTASKTYALTTSKVNYFTFQQPGVYTVAVSAKSLAYDSTSQSLESCWNRAAKKSCVPGVDSASVKITVVK